MVTVHTTLRTGNLLIVSVRLRGNNGHWGMAHQIFRTDVTQGSGYVRMFATIAEANRFVRENPNPPIYTYRPTQAAAL